MLYNQEKLDAERDMLWGGRNRNTVQKLANTEYSISYAPLLWSYLWFVEMIRIYFILSCWAVPGQSKYFVSSVQLSVNSPDKNFFGLHYLLEQVAF